MGSCCSHPQAAGGPPRTQELVTNEQDNVAPETDDVERMGLTGHVARISHVEPAEDNNTEGYGIRGKVW